VRNPLFNGTKAESTAHKIIKNSLLKVFLRYAKNIREGTLEKHIDTRRGDIYLELHDDKKVVVEVQNSRMSVKEALQRTKDYTKRKIYVLWILNDSGDCTAEPKSPRHRQHVRVSPFELFLHKIYGGRTYYIHINYSERGIFMSKPYALHFSFLIKNRLISEKIGLIISIFGIPIM
jgi:competence CoiA-like predicted nuclease